MGVTKESSEIESSLLTHVSLCLSFSHIYVQWHCIPNCHVLSMEFIFILNINVCFV